MDASKPALLFDMDGSTYDFQKPLLKLIKESTTLPKPFIEQMENTQNWTKIFLWDLFNGTNEEKTHIKSIIEPMYQNIEFFSSLEPYPGMVETVHSLESDFDIYFCTKPSKKDCGSESVKRSSIIKHFGQKYSERVITAHDKTMAIWDILVDDSPDIVGRNTKEGRNPAWKQILVHQPHNKDKDLPRLYIDRLDLWKWQIQELLLQTA